MSAQKIIIILIFGILSFFHYQCEVNEHVNNECDITIQFDQNYTTHLLLVSEQAFQYNFKLNFSSKTSFEIGQIIYNSTDPCLILGDGRCNSGTTLGIISDPVRKINTTDRIYTYENNAMAKLFDDKYELNIDSTCQVIKSPLEPDHYQCVNGLHRYRVQPDWRFVFEKYFEAYDSDYYIYAKPVYFIRLLYVQVLSDDPVLLTIKSTKTEFFSKEKLSGVKYVTDCKTQFTDDKRPEENKNDNNNKNNTINTVNKTRPTITPGKILRHLYYFAIIVLLLAMIGYVSIYIFKKYNKDTSAKKNN